MSVLSVKNMQTDVIFSYKLKLVNFHYKNRLIMWWGEEKTDQMQQGEKNRLDVVG